MGVTIEKSGDAAANRPQVKRMPRRRERGVKLGSFFVPETTKRAFLMVVLCLAFARIIPQGGTMVMLGCVVYALQGTRQGIEGLAMMFLILMGSVAWVGRGVETDIRWLVLFAAMISAWRAVAQYGWVNARVSRVFTWASVFVVANIIIGLGSSRFPTISVFKLISFWIGAFTLLVSFYHAPVLKSYWRQWFVGWFAGILVAGGLCLLWGGGFLKNGTGYEGMFDHPQTNGVVLATGAGFFLGQYLLRVKGADLEGLLGVLCLVAVYFSQSRTGMFAALLAAILTGGLLWFRHRHKLARTRLFRHSMVAGVVLLGVAAILPFQVGGLMNEFVAKDSSGVSGLSEAFTASREDLVDRSMANFREHPVTGIGFGVPSSYLTQLKTFMGIPMGASVEKGFLPAAILEETGIIGAALLITLLVVLYAMQAGANLPYYLWPMSVGILCNLGESMFFSIGGLGMFVWMMIGLAVAGEGAKTRRISKRKKQGVRQAHPTRVSREGAAMNV